MGLDRDDCQKSLCIIVLQVFVTRVSKKQTNQIKAAENVT